MTLKASTRRVATVPTISTSSLVTTSTSERLHHIRGGDEPSAQGIQSQELRGGAQKQKKKKSNQVDSEELEYEYEYVEDGEYDDADGEIEYEYYDYEGDGSGGEMEDSDYYYPDDEQYFFLDSSGNDVDSNQSTGDSNQIGKKRKFLPSLRNSFKLKQASGKRGSRSLSSPTSSQTSSPFSILSALPATIPAVISNISTSIPNSVSKNFQHLSTGVSNALTSIPSNVRKLDANELMESVGAGPLAAIALMVFCLVARSVVVSAASGSVFGKRFGGRNRRKKNLRTAQQRGRGRLWNNMLKSKSSEIKELDVSATEHDDGPTDIVDAEEKYSEQHLAADEGEEDTSVMDLDAIESPGHGFSTEVSKNQKQMKWRMSSPRSLAKILPSSAVFGRVQNLVLSPIRNGRLRGISRQRSHRKKKVLRRKKYEEGAPGVTEEMPPSGNLEAPTSESSDEVVMLLQQKINALTESQESLEQEYEASLRMLHEARMQLRKMQQTENESNESQATMQQQQQQQMEAMVKKLESKYKHQMDQKLERIRSQLVEKIRSEVELEMQANLDLRVHEKLGEQLEQQMEIKLKEMQEQYDVELQEEVESKVEEVKQQLQSQQEEERGEQFRQAVDEAVSEAVEEAVQEAVQQERQKAREEMMRVRAGIQKVLERERKLMKDQVRKATGQVKEWVAKQQQQHLQMEGRLENQTWGTPASVGSDERNGVEGVGANRYTNVDGSVQQQRTEQRQNTPVSLSSPSRNVYKDAMERKKQLKKQQGQ